MVSYEGIFFDSKTVAVIHSLELNQLPKVNDEIHCTFKYHPESEEIFDEIVGKTFEIYLIGYGNDGNNSGFEILLSDELKPYYINYDEQDSTKLKKPHITASLTDGAKASNTKNLNFISLKEPVKLVGRFGYWIKEEDSEYLSFQPHLKDKINIKKLK